MNPYYGAAALLYCVGIWIASANPSLSSFDYPVEGVDKLIHMIEYGGLATLLSLGMRYSKRRWSLWALCFGPMLLALGYGIVDETHQLFVPNRVFDFGDLVANFAGGAMTQLVLCAIWWRGAPSPIAKVPGEGV